MRIKLSFCPTGAGGGRDPSCSPGGGKDGEHEAAQAASDKAREASDKAIESKTKGDHLEARDAHREAAQKHREAGNELHAGNHERSAREHSKLASLFGKVAKLRAAAVETTGIGRQPKHVRGGRGGGGGGGPMSRPQKKKGKLKLSFCPTGPGGGKDPSCSPKDLSGAASQASVTASNVPAAKNPQDLGGAKAKSAAHMDASHAHMAAFQQAVKLGQPTHEGSPAGEHLRKSNEEAGKAAEALKGVNQFTVEQRKMYEASRAADDRSTKLAHLERTGGASFKELRDLHRKSMRDHADANKAALRAGTYSNYHNEQRVYHSGRARVYDKLIKYGKKQ